MAEILEPVHCKYRPIGLGRAVEGDVLAHPFEHPRDRRVVGAGGEKAAARDLVILALASGSLRALRRGPA